MSYVPRKKMASDLLDNEPKEGSWNGVTSDGVFKAIGSGIDNILDDGQASETVVVAVPSSQSGDYTVDNYYEVQGKVAKLRTKTDGDNVTQLTFDTMSGLLGMANDIVGSIASIGSPLQWKGPATVATLNAGITGIQAGWTYTLTDSGTLTDGSIDVEAGDEVAWTEDGDWFKVGGESGKVEVFQVTYDSELGDYVWPTYADVSDVLQKGKSACIVQTNPAGAKEVYWLSNKTTSSANIYCQFISGLRNFVKIHYDGTVETGTISDAKVEIFEAGGVPVTGYPSYAQVGAALAAGKWPVIKVSAAGSVSFYSMMSSFTSAHYKFIECNGQGSNTITINSDDSVVTESHGPSLMVLTGTYNPDASPADYSGLPSSTTVMSAINSGMDVILQLTNPSDNTMYSYRYVYAQQYAWYFMAITGASWTGGWKYMPVLVMTYAGPGNPPGWASTRALSQELLTATITEANLSGGHCGVNNLNALTTMTLTTVNSVTMHTNDYTAVNNFCVQIDNTGNSNDVTIAVQHGPDWLKYSVAGGNVVGAGKYMQLTCVGNCWTLAEFTAPTP